MKVAVITPYHREPVEVLQRCHDSVRAQTHACTHFMVADGAPQSAVGDWPVEHLVLPRSHGDYGNTPRCLGALSALNLGFDAIAFLDADNWYTAEHVASLLALQAQTDADVAFSERQIILPSGERLAPEHQEDASGAHIDTSCYLVTAKAAALIPVWAMMDKPLSAIGDRIVFRVIQMRGYSLFGSGLRTVFYESRHAVHYRQLGLEPPEDAHVVDLERMKADYSRERNTRRLGFDLGLEFR